MGRRTRLIPPSAHPSRRSALLLAAGGVVALGAPVSAALTSRPRTSRPRARSDEPAFIAALMSAAPDAAVRSFYAERTYSPLWLEAELGGLNPLGRQALSAINGAEAHGLSAFVQPARNLERLTAAPLSLEVAGRLEGGLSIAFTRFVDRLHRPKPENALIWTDRETAPDHQSAAALLSILASAPRPAAALAGMVQMHPAYEALAQFMKRAQAGDLDTGPLGGNAAFLKKAATNLDRLRALPVHTTTRHLMVNIASATLQTYESGVAGKTMRVIVGRAATPTPSCQASFDMLSSTLTGTSRRICSAARWRQRFSKAALAPSISDGSRPYPAGPMTPTSSSRKTWTGARWLRGGDACACDSCPAPRI